MINESVANPDPRPICVQLRDRKRRKQSQKIRNKEFVLPSSHTIHEDNKVILFVGRPVLASWLCLIPRLQVRAVSSAFPIILPSHICPNSKRIPIIDEETTQLHGDDDRSQRHDGRCLVSQERYQAAHFFHSPVCRTNSTATFVTNKSCNVKKENICTDYF